MALIKCRECEREVSSEAKVCPHCGCSTRERKKLKIWHKATLLFAAVVLVIVIIVVMNNNAWKSIFSVKYVGYVSETIGNGDYVYEITNESGKARKNVKAIIRVEALHDTVQFEDYVDFSIYTGETVEYAIRRSEIEKAFEEENADIAWIRAVEIVKITWD